MLQTRPLRVGLGVVLLALLQTSLLPSVTTQDVKPKEDLCAHSFHSFLCNPTKNAKRRIYDGRKKLSGDNSNLQPTVIKPDEPNLEGDNSNDDLTFQGPGYLPPVSVGSANNPEYLAPFSTTTSTTRRPCYPGSPDPACPTTRRPTTTSTTRRPCYPGSPDPACPTTRRPTTTTTTRRPCYPGSPDPACPTTSRPTTTTTTTRRPCYPGSPDPACPTTRRPTTTTTTTRRPCYPGSPDPACPTTRRPTTTTTTKRPCYPGSPDPSCPTTTRRPTTKSLEYLPPPGKEPNLVGGDSLLDPTLVLLPTTTQRVATTTAKVRAEDLCAHSFHSFLCDSNKPKKQRRIYNGQRTAPGDTNVLGENSFQRQSRILPPTTPRQPPSTTTTPKPRPPTTTTTPRPRPPSTTTTPRPRPSSTTTTTTQKPQPNRNLVPDNTVLSPAYLPPLTKPTTTTPDPDVSPDAAQNPSVRIKADNEVDLCKHSFHSFLCDSSKSKKQRRVYNGQRTVPENSNLLGANSFNRDSSVLPPPVKAATPRTTTTTTYRPKSPTPQKQTPNLVPDNSYTAPIYVKPTPQPTPRPTPEVFPDAASNADVRAKPDADLCSHSFHSYQCGGQKSGGRRRVHDGQHANIVGANSFRDAKRLRAPSRGEALDTAASTYRGAPRRYEFASSNVDEAHVAAPSTSKPIPASLAKLNPPTTTTLRPSEEIEPAAAAQAPSVVAQPDHHHDAHHHDAHHHDDHHQGDHAHAAATDHGHGHDHHGDHHGDHHHHHHNITLEQLCRDPFHAFLCLNVDSSKRRIYDGNPVEDSPSARERQQLLGSTSVRESRKVAAPSAVKTVDEAPKPVPLSYLQQRSQFPSASTPLTFDVTTYVREVPTTPQPQKTTTTTSAPPPRVAQTKYINLELASRPPPSTFLEESTEAETPRPAPRQRRPELGAPTPTQGTFPGERVRRPLRRRPRPDADAERQDVSFRPVAQSVPEFINRRSDDVQQFQEAPRRVRFGEKVPRRKRLPVPEAVADPDRQLSPGEFVRGPRGAVRELAATMEEVDPETRCKEPFQAFQCGHKVKREAKEEEKRTGNMRGAPQGHEAEAGAVEVKERVTEKTKRVKVNKRVEQRVKAEVAEVSELAEVAEVDKGVETTTEDQYVAYQRGVEEEKKRREEEEENRKEELKRREAELKNRKEELKRREKEQDRRKVEDRKRKEDLLKKKIEEAERKEALKKLENEERLEDAKEDRDDKDEDEEDDKEDAEKDELLSDFEKNVKAEEKRRAEEAKRREEELVRREEELKRREVEEKRRLAEAERRKVHDKLVEEELERRKAERIRVAEELVRREQEDERRAAAKEKAEAQAKALAEEE